ncbi:hypothetical protein NPIL_267271 [Nephila pilipes]|uniref:Uncharacterized protein n=1 Tax=Nephila pilipes TaxID=299642 RepID=A0A8X6MPZ6_NEPPI|nr:hypothetical protein NPIL_267271 [Nephila pilipes]
MKSSTPRKEVPDHILRILPHMTHLTAVPLPVTARLLRAASPLPPLRSVNPCFTTENRRLCFDTVPSPQLRIICSGDFMYRFQALLRARRVATVTADALSDRPISYLYNSYYALTTSSRSHGFMPRSAPPSTNEAPVYPTAIGAGGNRRGRLFASPDLPGPVWR